MPPATKKRKVEPKIEEITFDLGARQEYLTGFHKRKLQRAKFAQEKDKEKARLERIEERKKMREERKADLERHVQAVNDMLRPPVVDGEEDAEEEVKEWEGIEDAGVEPEPVDHEAEYVDEDKYTTVTVEAMDVTKDGLMRAEQEENEAADGKDSKDGAEQDADTKAETDAPTDGKRRWTKAKPKDKPHKPKKKRNFRYEGKLDRKANRVRQRRKNSEQAKARKAT